MRLDTQLQKCIRMEITIFKFSFGEVYRRLYVHKSCVTTCYDVGVKLKFWPYIRRHTSPNENIKYSYSLIVPFAGTRHEVHMQVDMSAY